MIWLALAAGLGWGATLILAAALIFQHMHLRELIDRFQSERSILLDRIQGFHVVQDVEEIASDKPDRDWFYLTDPSGLSRVKVPTDS